MSVRKRINWEMSIVLFLLWVSIWGSIITTAWVVLW